MNKREYNRLYCKQHKGDFIYWSGHQYRRMMRDERNKFNKNLSFSLDDFRSWLLINYKNIIYEMLQKYKDSDYDKYLSPSIDRIDDYKDYIYDNIQLITWNENNIKGRLGRKNKEQCGIMAKMYWSKTVYQYDTNMNLVNTFESTHDASRKHPEFNSSGIARACRLHKTYKGYRWEYEQ